MKAVVIGVVIALLGVSPAHGQSGPESDPLVPGAGDVELPLSPDSQGEGAGLSDCHELYAQGEWDEEEYGKLLECLFELSDLRRPESSFPGGSGDDTLDGNTQNDILYGGPGDDTLYGAGHNDKLHGQAGSDELYGGPGDDTAYGGVGDDTIDGGNGNDYINGGSDTDSCRRGEVLARCET